MQIPLVPHELLQRTDKILFVTHLALGDFTYLQNYFKAFSLAYPHIKIHIWVDELRRTRCFWRWEYLKKYALYDWLAGCSFVHKVYDKTYSPGGLKRSIHEAVHEDYPIVVSLATLRPHTYARLARKLSPSGFVVGIHKHVSILNIGKFLAYHKLDARIPESSLRIAGGHISEVYAGWFKLLFALDVQDSDRFPFVQIPSRWMSYAKLRFLKWGFDKKSKKFGRVIFINPFAKTNKRCWPLERVVELIMIIKKQDEWGDACFVVNIIPEEMRSARKFFDNHSLNNTYLFSAEHNFFQLPAILSQCDLIISVETAVMHLANAIHVPVIALMRQKNPEWAPIDKENSTIITTANRKDWVNAITAAQVMKVLTK